MATVVLRRLGLLVPQLLALSAVTFALLHLVPGDPVALVLGPRAAPGRVAELRAALGLDAPLPVQYGRYLAGLLQGDLGRPLRTGSPVLGDLLPAAAGSAELAGIALVVALAGGIGAGVVAAGARGRALDRTITAAAAGALAVPVFLVAPVLVVLLGDLTGSVLVPALCVAIAPAALLARAVRAAVGEAAARPFAVTARAKGLAERRVRWRHLLPVALVPVAGLLGLITASLVTGTVFVEVVFARAGLGRFAVEAVLSRDLPQLQAVVLLAGATYLLVNLTVDVVVGRVAPRLAAG